MKISVNKEQYIVFVILVLILILFNLSLRFHSLYLPHFTGDQRAYLGTAVKLDKVGIKGYNLKDIGLLISKDMTLAVFYYSPEERDLLDILERDNIYAYNIPFFHIPPLFSYTIMHSHRLLNGKGDYMVNMSLPKGKFSYKEFIKPQLYATIIPLISDLSAMLLVLFLGCVFFNRLTGLLAALFMCISPVSILTSQRVLADSLLTLLVLLAVSACYLSFIRNRWIFSILAGVFFGLSLLAKNSSIILIIPLLAIPFIAERGFRKGLRMLFSFKFIAIFLIAFFMTFPWYRQMVIHYKTPFYNIVQSCPDTASQWFRELADRPWYTFLADIPCQMPFYILGYFSIGYTFFRLGKADDLEIVSAAGFLSFLVILSIISVRVEMLGPENRYMLPAYPFLALLSANRVNKVRNRFHKYRSITDILIVILLLLVSIWSVKMALPLALDYRVATIPIPF